ncbi:MAG: DPP IV N-terminal domain-containing protein [Gemmatimonadales bacterium]
MQALRTFLSFAVMAAAPAAAAAQATPRALTAEDYARAERFLGETTAPLLTGTSVVPRWLGDGRFWYRATTPDGPRFLLVDPARKTRVPAFDHPRLASALSAATNTTIQGNRLPFQAIAFSRDYAAITVSIDNRSWRCELATYACAAAARDSSAAPRNSVTSPDGKRAAFIRDHNLWIRDLANGQQAQLTTDGVKDFGYATDNAGWVKSDAPVLTWSPDSKKIATFQHDGRGVSEMYLVNTTVGAPTLQAWKYPLPGDSVIFRISRVIIDVDAKRVVRLQMPPDQHRSTVSDHVACGRDICDVLWYPDGSHLAFVSSSRDHQHAWMRVANAATGEVRTLFEETSPTQIGSASGTENWRVLPASSELVWWSERENWGHLYRYDLATGQLRNRITIGEGNVADVRRVDSASGTIWFVGNGKEPGRDPYFRHFYKVRLDGKRQTLLTPEDADHTITMSPDGKWFVDVYSTPTTPPVSVLRDRNGKVVMALEKGDASRLLATGWKPPTPFTVKARDGRTDIYGLMWTPSRLDSTKKHPIIDYIYPGPQSGSVGQRSFSPAWRDNQALAELGFVVVAIDGMGTPDRSKDFADAYYGRMGDNTLPDQVAAIKQLAERYRWIDVDKVGIWGHSGGGFATAAAMFRYPDFFKVGIAESGNHDNRSYEDDWGERYQGLLSKNGPSDNYAEEANQTHAAKLKGKLLLAHGGLDGNVPPYNTYLVMDALHRANKDYDLIVFPNAGHGFGVFSRYMMRRRWDYFVRHLLGAEPPREYEIGRRATP